MSMYENFLEKLLKNLIEQEGEVHYKGYTLELYDDGW